MKAARLYSFRDIRIEEIPVPEIGPGDALVKTMACGICSGDVMPWYIEKKAPLVIGHEPAGEIVAVGADVKQVKVGDRVFIHHHAPCTACRFCRRGDHVQCETWRATRLDPGGIAEYLRVPSTIVRHDTLILPDTVAFDDATLIEPTACVVKGLRRTSIRRGDRVLVIGLGVMGMLNILLARHYGAAEVIGADRVPFRLDAALGLGADAVIDVSRDDTAEALRRMTAGEMAEIVVVGPNSVDAMQQGIACVRPGGQVLLFTPARPGEQLVVDPNELYFRDIGLVTSYSCGPDDTREALSLISEKIVSVEKIVTHRFGVESAAEAFRLTAEARDSLKVLVEFS